MALRKRPGYTGGGHFFGVDAAKIAYLCVGIPETAHAAAARAAGNAAAERIEQNLRRPETSTGGLARDLRNPKMLPGMRALVGSYRVYARIEDQGGVIRPRRAPILSIPPGGGYEDWYHVQEVEHAGKGWSQVVAPTYTATWLAVATAAGKMTP